jgi:hypothetical protein
MAQVGVLLPNMLCMGICGANQGPVSATCSVSAVDAESVTIACNGLCGVTGRRPEGLGSPARGAGRNLLGAYFAETARLEAASVDAFRILRDELTAWGAPRKLRRAAGRAARDEVRHARMTRALARRFGGTVTVPVVEKPRGRSLEAIARENAVEGCVRETFGALLATWQAHNALDAGIRAAMKRIAKDETRHAALSWSVATWLDGRLNRVERQRVAQARRAAVEKLISDLETESYPESLRDVGLPRREQATKLAGHLMRALWS